MKITINSVVAMGLLASFVASAEAIEVAALPTISLNALNAYPESLASISDGSLIFGSLNGGMLYRVAPGQDKAEPWIVPTTPDRSLYGVLADEPRGLLWVCSVSRQGQQAESELLSLSIKEGKLVRRYPFPGGGVCNDMAVAPDGSVYATDMSGGRILKLQSGGESLGVWVDDPRLKGIDGIVAFESKVYANNFRSGELYVFDRSGGDKSEDWDVLSISRPLEKPDGMRPLSNGNFLLVEGNGTLSKVGIHAGQAHLKVLYDGLEGTTAVALARGRAWVLDSKFRYLGKDVEAAPFIAYGIPFSN